jgi:hypothetical protein
LVLAIGLDSEDPSSDLASKMSPFIGLVSPVTLTKASRLIQQRTLIPLVTSVVRIRKHRFRDSTLALQAALADDGSTLPASSGPVTPVSSHQDKPVVVLNTAAESSHLSFDDATSLEKGPSDHVERFDVSSSWRGSSPFHLS